MGLSLDKLNRAAYEVQRSAKVSALLRSELRRVFGPTLDVDRPLKTVLGEVNGLLSTVRYRSNPPVVSLPLARKLAESEDRSVRLFAAHVLPSHLSQKLAFDKDAEVRHTVAWRVPPSVLDEMSRKWPHDDQLESIVSERGLMNEVKKNDKGMYEKVGDAGKQWEGPELSEQWYSTQADNLLKKYMNNLEYCWEETAVRQFVNAHRSTTGVVVDEKKLYDVLKKKINEREDERLEALDNDPLAENPLKESIDWLRFGGHRMNQNVFPILDEDVSDPVQKLLGEQCSSVEYVRKFTALYSVSDTPIPAASGKYRMGEVRGVTRVPVNGHVPGHGTVRAIDERALDRYCKCWNELQLRSTTTEPMQISWSHSPQSDGAVNFDAILR